MKHMLLTVPFALFAATAAFAGAGAKVTPPYAAPDVESIDQDGKPVKLAEVYKANPFVVVYFYPKADTPGCTKQGCSLRDAHPDLAKLGVKVIGVSADTAEAQKKFADKFTFPFTLLADKDGKVIDAFKVAKRPNGMASRQCFIVKNGQVVWHDAKGATDTQAAEVQAALKELK
ncbi:MAG: peroxiredoxin [Roseimicrobium sp.]